MSTSVASDDDFALAYDVERTARWIRRGDRRRIALQLPDDKLPDAARLATTLRRALDRDDPGGESAVEREVFVLADTTFGACCVDEVAAAHRDADAIVHFGRACCSPTSRTPARLVFDRRAMDVERCVRAIRAHATRLGAIEGEGRPRAVVALGRRERAARGLGRRAPREPVHALLRARAAAPGLSRGAGAAARGGVILSLVFYPPELERLVARRRHDAPPVRKHGNAKDLRRRHIITKVQRTPQRTQFECPFSVATHLPVATSHTLSVLSSDPDTTRRPSGETATHLTYNEDTSS